MSPEERQLLSGLFERIQNAGGGSRDAEAEAFIQDAVKRLPYAPYLLSQTVIVQDQALRAANERLQQLEAQVRELEQRAPQPQSGGFLGGLGSLFGGGPPQQAAPPPRAPSPGWGQQPQQGWQQPQQQYGQQPGPWGGPQGGPMGGPMGGGFGGQPQGGGFLKGALGAAAGVAGGVLLADSIKGLFGGHNNSLGIGNGIPGIGGAGLGGGETIVNNYYGDDAVRQADHQQDADQDQDDYQDAGDYSSGFGDDSGSSDI
jgi:hypothetical protein